MPLLDMFQGWNFGQSSPVPTQPGLGILNQPPAPVAQINAPEVGQAGAIPPQPEPSGWQTSPLMQGVSAIAESDTLADLGFGLLNSSNFGDAVNVAGNRSLQMAPERRKEAKTQQQINATKALLEQKHPEYLRFLESGYTPTQVMQLVLEDEKQAKEDAKLDAQRQQLAQLLPEGPGRAAVIAGADFNDIYKAQIGGTESWQKLDDGALFNEVTGEVVQVPGSATAPRPMTADDKERWGIPATDTTPYYLDEHQVPKPVAGGTTGDRPAAVQTYEYYRDQELAAGRQPMSLIEFQKDPGGFNVSQATAAGYADRMVQSNNVLTSPAITQASMDRGQLNWASVPLIGNNIVSPEYRQADQSKRDFINAILRRESGAVISPDEFANANLQYFPQPGDDAATLAQKEANRRNAINGVARSAGPAYEMPDTTNYLTGNLGAPAAGSGSAPVPQTQAEYDALPSGAVYIDPDDQQQYRKP